MRDTSKGLGRHYRLDSFAHGGRRRGQFLDALEVTATNYLTFCKQNRALPLCDGGICWACLFGFGAYAAGAEIYKISGTLSVISLGLFIAAGYALSIFIRRNEVTLRRRAEIALSDHSCG